MAAERGRVTHLWGSRHGYAAHVPVDGHLPMSIHVSSMTIKEDMKLGGRWDGGHSASSRVVVVDGYYQYILYKCMISSKDKNSKIKQRMNSFSIFRSSTVRSKTAQTSEHLTSYLEPWHLDAEEGGSCVLSQLGPHSKTLSHTLLHRKKK